MGNNDEGNQREICKYNTVRFCIAVLQRFGLIQTINKVKFSRKELNQVCGSFLNKESPYSFPDSD